MKLQDYISGSRSGEEANRIERKAMRDPFLHEVLDGYERVPHDTDKALEALRKEVRNRTVNRRKQMVVWSSVASIILLIVTGTYFLFTSDFTQPDDLVSHDTGTISPPAQPEVPELPVMVETPEETPVIPEKTESVITPPIAKKVEKPIEKSVIEPVVELPAPETRPEVQSKPEIESTPKPEVPDIKIPGTATTPHIYIAGNGHVFGVITDEYGEPIIGASVAVKGTNTGSITDIDGYFSLDTELGKELEISYIGYQTLTVPVREGNMNIAMRENNYALDEVVVVGYGTMARKSVTGAISTVKAKKWKKAPKPKPVDGYKALKKYILENNEYTGKAKVVLLFNIDNQGRPENIVVKKSTNEEAAREAIRLIENGPDWTTVNRTKVIKYTLRFK